MILLELVDRASRYYESILQLRDPSDEVLRYVRNQIIARANVKLTQVAKVTGGYDLYLSDQRWTRSLGNRLKKTFGGELVSSRKLFGIDRQSSKTLYRAVVCFRPINSAVPVKSKRRKGRSAQSDE